jgi:hypothetical protein
VQKQYSDKAARLIAKELNLTVDVVDPYAENYIDNLRSFAQQIVSP